MRLSKSFFQTLKEAPKEAQIPSHVLMIRSGMIQQLASGIYNYLPLAERTLTKIRTIIREELNKAECEEVSLPMVQPAELWQESGRWNFYGPELLRLHDRRKNEFCLGPTHEEVLTDMVRRVLKSYKQLPWNLFQIQTKFRDEIRPRFGLMRGREFIMKDGYSFDADVEGAKLSYQKMYEAYHNIFRRCGLEFRAVEAATGNIGGSLSHEFQVLADTGEDKLLYCQSCDYAANHEHAELIPASMLPADTQQSPLTSLATPNVHTIEEVAQFTGKDAQRILKTLLFKVDEELVLVVLPGDKDINDSQLLRLLEANTSTLATEDEVKEVTGARLGFAGPINLLKKIKIVVDNNVQDNIAYICGANKDDTHLQNVFFERDFTADVRGNVCFAEAGDLCPQCHSKDLNNALHARAGVEVGHIFYLGQKYSQAMNCTFLDNNGKKQFPEMGCYGIGVGRTMAAAIEQNHDENGIVWPLPIAPYELVIIALQMKDDNIKACCENYYKELRDLGWDVVFDDRDERPGIKFNDADLVGYPVQIIVGKRGLDEGKLEVKIRKGNEKHDVAISDIHSFLSDYRQANLQPSS